MYCPGYKDMPTGNDIFYCDPIHFPAKFFFKYRFDNFSLTHKEKEVWPDGTHPMLFTESICVFIPKF